VCGTPVISFRRGGTPEGITDGVTGFVCDDLGGMIDAVSALPTIDRARCRQEAEQRFSHDVITDEYESLYRELAERRPS
jgi:glycosyltransferase involved in cell wall biosynthesis